MSSTSAARRPSARALALLASLLLLGVACAGQEPAPPSEVAATLPEAVPPPVPTLPPSEAPTEPGRRLPTFPAAPEPDDGPTAQPSGEPGAAAPQPAPEPGSEALPDIALELGLDGLIDLVASDPSSAGAKGEDLLGELQRVQARPDDGRRIDRALQRVNSWEAEGSVNPTVAEAARIVLQATRSAGGEDDDGRGRGDEDD